MAETKLWQWNRRIHFLLGLYLLLFIWLFSISGLVLNHGKWTFAEFWPRRTETSVSHVIERPGASGDVAIAKALMSQLGISGEINRIERDAAGETFRFQVIRPGHTVDVVASFSTSRADVTEVRVNAWGVLSALHHFTGVSMDDPDRTRDWWLTRIWSLSMDAVAVGLIILVASGLYLWWRLEKKRVFGLLVLAGGTAGGVFFLFGLGLF